MRIDSRKLEKMAEWMEKREDIPKGWIYLGDDTECYFIGQPGKRNVLVFLANPGTSIPGDNNIDSTIKKVKKLATEDVYDGWIMAYLYPLRTKDSKELPEKEDKKLLEKNLKVLMALVKSYKIDAVWASWGNTIDTRFYLGDNLYDIQEKLECDCEWYYRGTMTRDGNPRHPSYIKSGDEYRWFPVCDYAANWRYADVYF